MVGPATHSDPFYTCLSCYYPPPRIAYPCTSSNPNPYSLPSVHYKYTSTIVSTLHCKPLPAHPPHSHATDSRCTAHSNKLGVTCVGSLVFIIFQWGKSISAKQPQKKCDQLVASEWTGDREVGGRGGRGGRRTTGDVEYKESCKRSRE